MQYLQRVNNNLQRDRSAGHARWNVESAENQTAICLGEDGWTVLVLRSAVYRREEADTEVKKRLVFTADHLHPRAHGGRGRANKVPACKYCNSHKSSRSVEQFRQWVQKLLFDKA